MDKRKGLTLLEFIIGCVFFQIAFLSFAYGFQTILRLNDGLTDQDIAYKIAYQESQMLELNARSISKFNSLLNQALLGVKGYYYVFDGGGGAKGKNAIVSHSFTSDDALFNELPYLEGGFDPEGLCGSVVVYLDTVPLNIGGKSSILLDYKIVVSYRSQSGVIGEDKNLDGRLSAGEDTNEYSDSEAGKLDSIVQIRGALRGVR